MGRVALLFILAIAVSSCGTARSISDIPYYVSAPTAPILRTAASHHVSVNAVAGGGDLSIDYALYNNIGIVGGGTWHRRSDDRSGNQWSGEIGIDLFDTAPNGIEHELSAGGGWGSEGYHWESVTGDRVFKSIPDHPMWENERTRFWKLWLQADAGYVGRYGSFMVIARSTYVNVYHDVIDQNYYIDDPMTDPHIVFQNYSDTLSKTMIYGLAGFEATVGFDPINIHLSLMMPIDFEGLNDQVPRWIPMVGMSYKF